VYIYSPVVVKVGGKLANLNTVDVDSVRVLDAGMDTGTSTTGGVAGILETGDITGKLSGQGDPKSLAGNVGALVMGANNTACLACEVPCTSVTVGVP
jgi:hypothetical protein